MSISLDRASSVFSLCCDLWTRTVLTEIYGHLCINDIAVKTALIHTGPRPFTLQCSAPWGTLGDTSHTVSRGNLISDILIDTRVQLATGKLTSAEWLAPGATSGGLRHATRWLVAALLPVCSRSCLFHRFYDIYWLWLFLIVTLLKAYIGLMLFIYIYTESKWTYDVHSLTLILRISEYTAVYLRLLWSPLFSVGFGSATPSPVVDAPVGSVTPDNQSLCICSLAWWISRSCLCLYPGGRFPASLGSTVLSRCMGPLMLDE